MVIHENDAIKILIDLFAVDGRQRPRFLLEAKFERANLSVYIGDL